MMISFRIKKSHILLAVVLLLAFFLRIKFLDFPVIGWHSVKEAEPLSIAKGFISSNDFLHRKVFFYSGFSDGPGFFELYPQMPLLAFWAYFVFVLFGERLWLVRLFPVICSVGSVLLIYLIIANLSSKKLALLSSFVMAVLPLSVYYGRNIMPESPSLFFLLLSLFLFLKWSNTFSIKLLIFSSLSFSLAVIFKYSLAPFLMVHFFLFPYAKYKINLKDLLAVFLCLLPIVLVFSVYQLSVTGELQNEPVVFANIHPFDIFSPGFWFSNKETFFKYFKEGFSVYAVFSVLGLFLLRKSHSLFRLVFGFLVAFIPYLLLVGSFYFVNNAYYLYPFTFLFAVLSAIFFERIFLFNRFIFFIIIIASLPFVSYEINYFYSYFTPGQEIAGEYIKDHSFPFDRILLYGISESVSVCYYAERRCGFLPDSVEEFNSLVGKFNIPFIYVLATRFEDLKISVLWPEIERQYAVKQVGGPMLKHALLKKDTLGPAYYILEKGFKQGSVNISPVRQKSYSNNYDGKYYFFKNTVDLYTITY